MMKFYKCDNDSLIIPVTNNYASIDYLKNAEEISPNTMEASTEKHIPIVTCSGNTVKVNVGSVAHPMTEEHSITTVILETRSGGQYKFLHHGDEPIVQFDVSSGDKAMAAYAYCNLHGLWKADID